MGFIRPETKAFFWRWREAFVGLGILIWGIWLVATSIGLTSTFGMIVTVIGIVWIFAGSQRARFRVGNGGAGLVQVDERAVIYFGPLEGGTVSIDALMQVELHPIPDGGHLWVLIEEAREPLRIPTDAEHSEDLFDAFGALEGFDTQRMLNALNALPAQPVVIWQASAP